MSLPPITYNTPLLELVALLHHRDFYWGSIGGFTNLKYLTITIDTRDNMCVVKDRDGQVVSLDEVRRAMKKPIRGGMNANPAVDITPIPRAP